MAEYRTSRDGPLRRLRSLAPFAAAPLLAGCILDPRVPDPVLDIPVRYTGSVTASIGDQHRHPMAFEMFGSRTLVALISEARAANTDIAAAVARIYQADAQVRIATQPLIPALDLVGNATQSYGGQEPARGLSRNVSAALNASYELDFWGRNRAGKYSAQASAIAVRFDGATIAIETDASVADTYFQAVTLRRRIAIARKNLGTATGTLDAIRERLQAGTVSGLDVAQQETLVANLRVVIPPLEQSYAQFVNALAVLLGRPPEHFKLGGEDVFTLRVPGIAPGLPSELLCQRPDIAAAEANLAAARFDVSASRAALFPSIQLTGQGGFESTALKTLFRPDSLFYQVGAGLTQPLLSAYGLQAQLDLDRARYTELLETYRGAIISAFRDVEDALVAYRKSAEQERLQRLALTSARKAYEITETQLRSGTIDVTTLLSVQQNVFTAEDAVVEARLARLQAAVSLYRVLGGGWNRPLDTAVAQAPAAIAPPETLKVK
jgi:NodT family efflux transporter outer membrane factor (OMF) lipoprotein